MLHLRMRPLRRSPWLRTLTQCPPVNTTNPSSKRTRNRKHLTVVWWACAYEAATIGAGATGRVSGPEDLPHYPMPSDRSVDRLMTVACTKLCVLHEIVLCVPETAGCQPLR